MIDENTPQGTAVAPQGTAVAPQGTAVAPQGTAVAPQGTAVAPQGTAVAPQGTAVAPQGTAVAPAAPAVDGKVMASGTEARLVDQGDGKILKLYNPGFKCNAKVLPLVQSLKGKGYVVDLFDFGTGTFDGRKCDFELMEKCAAGAASGFDVRGNKDAVLAIVVRTALNLAACHKAGFIHKDIKPANILIRNKEKWDCVLCDFGIADILEKGGKVSTIQSRTPIYAAPEVYDSGNVAVIDGRTYCQLTPAADFYSLGMTALCLWYGEKAFLSRESEMAIQKVKGNIKVPAEIPDPLNKIIRGLLVKDPTRRWGIDEIKRAMKGEDVPVYEGGMEIIFNGAKNQVAHSTQELAALMLSDPDLGIRYLYSGKISEWLSSRPELQLEIDKLVEKDYPKNRVIGFACTLHLLNPLYDLNLCCDPKNPEYAMTGAAIGRKLNQAYEIWWGKFGADRKAMNAGWDSDCKKQFRGPDFVYDLVSGFDAYSSKSYLVWFLTHKGKRFDEQLKWLKYCLDFSSREFKKKAGPKDDAYRVQTAMMKTIVGFGHTPTYSGGNLGIRGFLAVQYHENPNIDMKPKYTYEKLLGQYLAKYREAVPGCLEGVRYDKARRIASDTADEAMNGDPKLMARVHIQRIIGIILVGIPALFLLVSFADRIMNGGTAWAWIFGILTFALFILYVLRLLFAGGWTRIKKLKTMPGFEELTMEPLYFAFNNDNSFTSSLEMSVDRQGRQAAHDALTHRRNLTVAFTLIFWLLVVVYSFASKAADNAAAEREATEQVQAATSVGDASKGSDSAKAVKPKKMKRGIIYD